MTDRTYIIALDGWNPTLNPHVLDGFIRNSTFITNCWNDIPFVFIVTSPLDAETLSEHVKEYAPGIRFLVMEANPAASEGSLPPAAWEWIKRRSGERVAGA